MRALRWCLESTGTRLGDIDEVGVAVDPDLLADRRAAFDTPGTYHLDEAAIRDTLGVEAPVHFVRHHLAHASSAFDFSPFDDAAVLVVDGVGEWDTTTIWSGDPQGLTQLDSIDFPHSLGLFYAAITEWLGFRPNHDEYKVMGLASYGSPLGADRLAGLVPVEDDWRFRLVPEVVEMILGDRHASADALAERIGPRRLPHQPVRQMHADLAACAQRVLEDRVIALARRARERTRASRLCTAGGVLLNAVANRRIRADAGFDAVWFQPVAGDAGTALGAAATVARRLGAPPMATLDSLALGPRAIAPTGDRTGRAGDRLVAMLEAADIAYDDRRGDPDATLESVADLIAAGAVVGWCDGPSEFGPRALGQRSILADARPAASRDRINDRVKERESWRPLAPMIADRAAPEFLELTVDDHAHRFMIETVATRGHRLEATTHIDGTARPQLVAADRSPRLAALLDAVAERTGVPAVVNTSFNHAGEPIVATADQALVAAVRCRLDALVIGDIVVTELPTLPPELIDPWCTPDVASTTDIDQLYPL